MGEYLSEKNKDRLTIYQFMGFPMYLYVCCFVGLAAAASGGWVCGCPTTKYVPTL